MCLYSLLFDVKLALQRRQIAVGVEDGVAADTVGDGEIGLASTAGAIGERAASISLVQRAMSVCSLARSVCHSSG